ncbi:MAG: glycoside hydrolase family 2 protein, partial [Chitinophagales bacterium]
MLEVKNANMNMLRIWGGGIYEKDVFYNLCDSLGILVWQDFMFACAMYPGDSAFLSNVKKEITYQVKRLRNHPSIALWCGNNEIDEAWHNWGWQSQYHYNTTEQKEIWSWYENVFHHLIPEVLSQTDTSRNYWPSSPSIGWGHKESLTSGDVHYWGVWWGNQSFEYYNQKVGRFMSEYGFQGMPSYRSFKNFTPLPELRYNSPTLKTHQKHPVGYETIFTYMQREYPVSDNLASSIYLSQLLQARGISIAMEAHRRNRPYCMGSLYWQMNDCWPVTSWSAIDYYGNRKALYYASKKTFAPLALSIVK